MMDSENSDPIQAPDAFFSRFKFRAALRIALILVIYLLAFTILDSHSRALQVFPTVVAWYPPDGLSFALLLSFGARFLPVVAIASLVSSLFVFQIPLPFSVLFGWAVIVSLAYGLAAWSLRRRVRIDTQLRGARDLFWLIASTAVVSTVLALISISASTAGGVIPQSERFWATFQWWTGEMIGVLVVTPVLLLHVMPRVKRFAEGKSFLRKTPISFRLPSRWVILQMLGIVLAIYLAVDTSWPNDFHPFFLVAIPLIWIAIQHGLSGATLGIVLVNFGITWRAQGHGHFSLQELGQLQLMMLIITIASLLVGVLVSESRRSMRSSDSELDRRRKKIVYELVIISILGMAAWVLEFNYDLYEAVTQWEGSSQIKGLDETLVAILFLGLASAVFAFRRWRELQVEMRGREKAEADLRILLLELEQRVQERTVDLSEANKLLQAEIIERERVEATLRVSEDRYRDLVDHSHDLICTHDLEGRILSVNYYSEQVLGYETGALLNTNLRDILTPGARKQFDDYLSDIKKHGIAEGTMIVRTASGKERIWKYRNTLRTEGVSEPIVRGMARDITEQHHAERALRESEQRFRHLFAASPDAILLIDPHHHLVSWPIVDCNEAACRMNGYTREEMIGQSIDILNIMPGSRQERVTYLERLRREKVISVETFHRHKDGYIFPVEVSTTLFVFDGRELVVGIDRDITERRRAEKALEESEKRFRALIENSADAITLLDANGLAIYDSPAAPGLLGYGPDELIGQNILALLHPEDLMYIQPVFRELVETPGARSHNIFRIRHKNGSWRWIEAVSTNLLSYPGVGAIVVNYRDITERKLAEEALSESDKRYRSLFEDSPVSLWEEDFSQVKAYLDRLKGIVGTDLESYLDDHPEVITECAGLVKVLDVNRATMDMYGVDDKTTLLDNTSTIFTPETLHGFRQELMVIWKGERKFENDGIVKTLAGQHRDVTIIWAVVPGYEDDYSRVLVSLIDITERRQAAEEIRARTEELVTLYELSRALAEANDLDKVLDLVNRWTVTSVHITFARIALLEGDELVTRSAYPVRVMEHDLFIGGRNPTAAMPYCLGVLEGNEPVIVRANDPGLSDKERAALLLDFAQSVCLVPLRVYDFATNSSQTLGLLMMGEARREEREPFTIEKIRLARSIGDQAAIAIDNTRLFNDLQRSNDDLRHAYDATIAGWSAAMDLRDRETEGHTQRVTEMTYELAKRLGFSEQDLVQVRRGALLHDIGKMGVPDRILLKPDKLTDEEWEIMRMHPTFAYQMLEPISYLGPALDIPYCHHEKWDGTGYPRRLKGTQIPLAARIFAVVDVFDALTSDRPYRKAWSRDKTLEYIRELSGSHFDPKVVAVFLQLG